jgi:hypothetical protein
MGQTRWLTPATGYVSGYTHTLNPYKGCSFGCSYCYVRRLAVSPLLPHTHDFARLIADTVPRVVVDDYFRGDGSGGKRSQSLRMPEAYEQAGWNEWYKPEAADRLFGELKTLMPQGASGFSVEGFAPPGNL